jgi:hypothetical protein
MYPGREAFAALLTTAVFVTVIGLSMALEGDRAAGMAVAYPATTAAGVALWVMRERARPRHE